MVSASSISELERATMHRVAWRLLPFLILCYLIAIIDRGNIGMASLQMNQDLGLSPAIFGFASSLFFVAYFLVEVPSNLALQKFGARMWIARIMITWGLVSAGTAFVQGANSLYVMRFLLGAAEAGFFPGVLLYLTYWLPSAYRARMVAIFMVAIPGANFLGSPLSGFLLTLDGMMGMRGWHWLFILEGIPAVLLGIACLFVLTDRPEQAKWLTDEQRNWLTERLNAERLQKTQIGHISLWRLLKHKDIWAMILIYTGASAAGSTMSVWAPQLLKTFHLDPLQIGLVNAIPYGLASIAMIAWGRSSDKRNERRWHTATTLYLIAAGLLLTLVTGSLVGTVVLLSMVLIGAYSMKGPFWALASGWMSSSTAAAGLAAIGAWANLFGGGMMVNIYGAVHGATGSYALALLPLALLNIAAGSMVLIMGRKRMRENEHAASVANAR
ncbi:MULTISPECIES: MFS transporter [unclassified Pseudomonas]|uniref:MFS transporter n=1 Tax=unclassified Pseudomonas TaxID=196821 RepID=UPI000BD156B9|nr:MULTISPECIES: MFS transporter [unclassified Pseudomonas]PVZ20524.1 nitrate/nitrite transporter NarK [Pseudomonas sp. URIL14HWK12:I12]PVZ27590.1 nitrate/nitrite transporter NarK [Pseudomonas sp. URIL14HWK12:I10]PVZ38479.1 nitrate/nitrite transporter NarK [Pseudomonas sp. URIL14HWK12:I11]SNZ03193.1 Nitrate/nitrite transporter NarK [Pseudomonas sp. URIL14HWK12:I9]